MGWWPWMLTLCRLNLRYFVMVFCCPLCMWWRLVLWVVFRKPHVHHLLYRWWGHGIFSSTVFGILRSGGGSEGSMIGYDDATIHNTIRGGRDVFNLREAKAYFFLSGWGYCFFFCLCFEGIKVAVRIQEISPEPLLPNPAYGSQSYVYYHIILLAVLAMAASAWTFPF